MTAYDWLVIGCILWALIGFIGYSYFTYLFFKNKGGL